MRTGVETVRSAVRGRLLLARRFRTRLDRAVAAARTGTGPAPVVALVELDRFDLITDGLGRAAGDDLLREVATRIGAAVPEAALGAKLGRNRFAVTFLDHDGDGAADGVDALRAALGAPYSIGGVDVVTAASIGVATYPDDGREAESLLDSADRAVTRVKSLGGNAVLHHEPAMRVSAIDRLELESALRGALDRGELWVAYQPRVDIASGAILGAEALVRWDHPTLGPIPPTQFVPIAEETGLIDQIGEWVLERSCRQMLAWDAAGLPPITVAVNVSPRQFELGSVATMVRHVLERTGLDAHRLELELTESVDLQDPDTVSAAIAELRRLGVHCAIDDFGTGYSCLSHLTHMPIAALKIDRAFTRAIGADPDGSPHSTLVVTVIELARRLDLFVVAEGVEHQHQLDFLRRHGCAQAQGYLFSRPVAADDFATLLRTPALTA